MFSKTKPRLRSSFAVRATLLYAVLFAIYSAGLMLAANAIVRAALLRQTDEFLVSSARKFADLSARRKPRILAKEFEREARHAGFDSLFLRMADSNGVEIASSDYSVWQDDAIPKWVVEQASPGRPILHTGRAEGGIRIRSAYVRDERGGLFQVSRPLVADDRVLGLFNRIVGVIALVNLLACTAVGYFVVRSAMRRVERVRDTACAIREGEDLRRRLDIRQGGDEIEDLANEFNSMLERIETLVRELKEVSDGVAHDLRTPLTRIRGMAEVVLTGSPDAEEYRNLAATVIEESDRLARIVDTILEIARMEAGARPMSFSAVDTARLLRETHELFEPVAEGKGIKLVLDLSADLPNVEGDRACLQRLVSNLVDNAVKFTPPDGRVRIQGEADASEVRILVEDSGDGITEEEVPLLFRRFHRPEKSRAGSGTGLGLSLAMAFAKVHGGTITVAGEPGKGSIFTAHLPRASARKAG